MAMYITEGKITDITDQCEKLSLIGQLIEIKYVSSLPLNEKLSIKLLSFKLEMLLVLAAENRGSEIKGIDTKFLAKSKNKVAHITLLLVRTTTYFLQSCLKVHSQV